MNQIFNHLNWMRECEIMSIQPSMVLWQIRISLSTRGTLAGFTFTSGFQSQISQARFQIKIRLSDWSFLRSETLISNVELQSVLVNAFQCLEIGDD